MAGVLGDADSVGSMLEDDQVLDHIGSIIKLMEGDVILTVHRPFPIPSPFRSNKTSEMKLAARG